MNKSTSVALLVAGVVLTLCGVTSMESFSSDVSRAVTGAPTDRAMWLLIGGIAATIVGLFGVLRGSK